MLDSIAGLPNGNQVFAVPETFTAHKDTRELFVTYNGATGEVFILLGDLHAAVQPC